MNRMENQLELLAQVVVRAMHRRYPEMPVNDLAGHCWASLTVLDAALSGYRDCKLTGALNEVATFFQARRV